MYKELTTVIMLKTAAWESDSHTRSALTSALISVGTVLPFDFPKSGMLRPQPVRAAAVVVVRQ